ncbi:hypothetical protein [Nocardia sp. XZ_19_369]|uniref:hypothetical protein n=1 Tax=Nocardia sp. XZ_19_369 TaxID=2769487 RepID=UPI00188F57FE|nr:hypothetical protein [Nocardia sp. XZ_19_369]
MSSDGFGVKDFQLYLLKTMDPPESLLTTALAEMGCSIDDMDASLENIQKATWLSLGGSAEKIVTMLSEVCVSAPARSDHKVYAYNLPLWPEFDFVATFDLSGKVLSHSEFVRFAGRGPETGATPWDFTERDLVGNFDQITRTEDWGSYTTYHARDTASDQWYWLRFGWGLLQDIRLRKGLAAKPEAN